MGKSLSDTLVNCEENGSAPKYVVNPKTYLEAKSSIFAQSLPVKTEPIKYNAEGEEIFVVSDLHIASGRNDAGVYKGTENFFADDSFKRFLSFAQKNKKTPKALLVANGDIFDFLRITEYPGKVKKVRFSKRLKHFLKFDTIKKASLHSQNFIEDQFLEWHNELEKIGISKSTAELEQSISKKEKRYGLQTDDYKTIYKLLLIKKGHPDFFTALANWLAEGNKLVILKGNHDLEIYWLAVRNYLRLILAENILLQKNGRTIEEILEQTVLPNITFIDDSIEIDDIFYIEHGHRYDKFCMVLKQPVLNANPKQINIPFGSFFNRYLINRVELFFPFIDNVRPSGNVLPVLMKENFPLAVKILFQHIPFMIRMLLTNFRYIRFMFHKVFWFFISIAVPAVIVIWLNFPMIKDLFNNFSSFGKDNNIISAIFGQLKNVSLLFLAYILSRLVAWFQLDEPSSLDTYAKERFKDTKYKIMTMGHTHNPGEYLFNNDCRFYNTGTWIPVIETSTADVREDKTYTFLHLIRDNGELQVSNDRLLQRWNDDAGRAEPQVLVERK